MTGHQRCLSRAMAVNAMLLFTGIAASAAGPAMQKRVIAGADSAKQWSAAESSIEASSVRTRGDGPALHWHITVDHFAGEPKYPIGWPRIGYTLREPTADWSGWDYLQMWVYTDTTRDALPREPVGLALYTPDKDSAYNRTLSDLVKGQWVQIRIPLAQVPHHEDVRLIQLHISESNYRHQDQLDFYLDGVALLRYAQPTMQDFAAEEAAMFTDAKQMPVRFNLTGVKPGETAEVTCELRQSEKVFAKAAVTASRGPQRMILNLDGAKLPAGDYDLRASVAGGTELVSTRVRLVESPWKSAE